MEFLKSAPVWQVCAIIFALRIVDVSIGTVRTLAVVRGHPTTAVVLGFFEVLIWLLAISQVMSRAVSEPIVALFYAGGYATGNGVGILIERAVTTRLFVLRLISSSRGRDIAQALAPIGRVIAVFPGETPTGTTNLVYVSATRQTLPKLVEEARRVDPDLFYLIEPVSAWSENLAPLTPSTGWRAVFKRK